MLFARYRIPNVEKLKKKRDLYGLIQALKHPTSAETRVAAVYALRKDERAIYPLIVTALNDPHDSVRLAAIEVLRGQIWPLHRKLESSREERTIISFLKILKQLNDRSAESLVVTFLDANEDDVRGAAVETLSEIGGIQTLPRLERLYAAEKSSSVREKIEESLGVLRRHFYSSSS